MRGLKWCSATTPRTSSISRVKRRRCGGGCGFRIIENALDKQIAAAALTHGLTLVTRNVDDFRATGVSLLNPFQGAGGVPSQ